MKIPNSFEMTRLCAEAMGYLTRSAVTGRDFNVDGKLPLYIETPAACRYNPLHDDAQAMALVKRFHIALGWNNPGWGAFRQDIKNWEVVYGDDELNYAIVRCVAKMQASK